MKTVDEAKASVLRNRFESTDMLNLQIDKEGLLHPVCVHGLLF